MSESAKRPLESEYLTFGGMAVVEAVMMRSPNYWAIACRAPNGNIVVKTEPLAKSWVGRQEWLKKPFLRGSLAMFGTMALGTRAMNVSAAIQAEEKYQPDPAEGGPVAKPGGFYENNKKWLDPLLIAVTVVVSLALSFTIFNAGPQFLAEYLVRIMTGSLDKNKALLATNYIAEVIKVVFFVGYLSLISRMPTIMELFRYHGAEHKAINAVEAELPLTVENCQAQTRLHPRCGTNFVIIVTLVSFLLFPLIPRDLFVPATSPGWLVALSRLPVELACLPLVAGISYEVIRAAGKQKNEKWVRTILKPGLMTQLVTTAEPQDKHVEVAIGALKAVMTAEASGELTNEDSWEYLPVQTAAEPA